METKNQIVDEHSDHALLDQVLSLRKTGNALMADLDHVINMVARVRRSINNDNDTRIMSKVEIDKLTEGDKVPLMSIGPSGIGGEFQTELS